LAGESLMPRRVAAQFDVTFRRDRMRSHSCAFAIAVTTFGIRCGLLHAQGLLGHVEAHSFLGPVTDQVVNFNIYLPEGYDQTDERYPVIYHVHGIGGTQGGPQNMIVPGSFEAAKAQGVIGPVIVVFPNGYNDSFWADSVNGAKPAETDVVQQLIPYVDANFRSIATPGARIIEGFSMGGFGATKFYTKFPELFAACIEYDGAMVTWPIMLQFHAQQAASIFGNSEAYFDQFSPWHWSSVNAEVLDKGPLIRMVVGARAGGNQNFRDHLKSLGIPVDYVATGCGHDLGCLFGAQGLVSAAFIAAHLDLSQGSLGDVDGDGVVNIDDLLGVINAWGACPSPPQACPADQDGSDSVDLDDLLVVLNNWSSAPTPG
jgi:enterochelin esterase-like enzyme